MIRKILAFAFAICALNLFVTSQSKACTSMIVTKGASKDGSVMITYIADAMFHPTLDFYPAADHKPGDSLDIYDWDDGAYRGKIAQVAHTYKVVGLMNEYQVSIGETTAGGREELHNKTAILDYGTLMRIALQRSKTAREAIETMIKLTDEYGYASECESMSVSDKNEAWIFEIIGKGPGKKGMNYVALRIPDGYICAHANQARIREFPLKDKENCLYNADIIDFAIEKGYYKKDSKTPFRYDLAFCPPDGEGLRFCEGRVWSIFRRSAPSQNISMDYVKGIKGAELMPLWIKPDKKLSVADVMSLMRDHFEGTEWDMTKGYSAGAFQLPYRWRPLSWKVDSVKYGWERAASTQQTGFSFVAQSRSNMPDAVGGVFWYGLDDTYSTCYTPLYCSINAVPKSYQTGTYNRFSWESAWWVFNFVSNYAYSRYSLIIKDIQVVQSEYETKYFNYQPAIEKAALDLNSSNPELCKSFLTDYSVGNANTLVSRWKDLGEELLTKYIDGYVKDGKGKAQWKGYPEEYLRETIKQEGAIRKISE